MLFVHEVHACVYVHACMCLCVWLRLTDLLQVIRSDGSTVRVKPPKLWRKLVCSAGTGSTGRSWGSSLRAACRPPRPSAPKVESWLSVVGSGSEHREKGVGGSLQTCSDSEKWQWTGNSSSPAGELVWLLLLLLPRTLIRQHCSHSPAGGLLGCRETLQREQRSLLSFTLITLKTS